VVAAVALEKPAPVAARPRLVGLDGIRGLAALFVVVNHIFLRAFPGYPVNHAPFWAAPFIYGRFAVVVFIVLSGFSLSVSAARAGWRLDGVATFARRRAWRILPPYWAALVFSLLMTWFVVAQPGWAEPNARSVIVNGLLVQDVFGVPSPNRAFWSIAIEAQLYVVFPLLILAMRRLNALALVAAVATPVLVLGLAAAAHVDAATDLVDQYTPDLAVLFAIGVAAAGILTATDRHRARPWHWYALALAVPVVALISWRGSVWTIHNIFWIDLAFGPAIGCLLAAVATHRPRPLVRVLDARPLRGLGLFSYSLYLTHAPIVIAVYYGVVQGRVPPGVPTFLVLCATVLPLTVVFARLFAEVFELPFQRRRGFTGERRAARPRRDRRPWTPVRRRAGARSSTRRPRAGRRSSRAGRRGAASRC
jgi:peptidoglycan/LPS O-acetylase OafA/YrhL